MRLANSACMGILLVMPGTSAHQPLPIFLNYLLANPLRTVINGSRERYLIVIDALAEAGKAGRNLLVEMLARNAQRLPDWFGLVVTSEPESAVKTPQQ
ncbi:MAG TPA: hypothetical protein VIW67_16225 [Terriglobales bacterium]